MIVIVSEKVEILSRKVGMGEREFLNVRGTCQCVKGIRAPLRVVVNDTENILVSLQPTLLTKEGSALLLLP